MIQRSSKVFRISVCEKQCFFLTKGGTLVTVEVDVSRTRLSRAKSYRGVGLSLSPFLTLHRWWAANFDFLSFLKIFFLDLGISLQWTWYRSWIDCFGCYALSAILQPCNGCANAHDKKSNSLIGLHIDLYMFKRDRGVGGWECYWKIIE